jgi:hypothetical protein
MTFTNDLKKGKKMEHKICDKIKKKYPNAYVVEGECKEYDIVVPEIGITIEAKFDEKSTETGNYIIEMEHDGKPSGISVTKANYWVIVDKEIVVWITAEALRFLIRDCQQVTYCPEGDKIEKKGYLIPVDKLRFSNYSLLTRL